MLAPIAVQTPQPTEASRSQTSDAKTTRGQFASILDEVQSQKSASPSDETKPEDAPTREVKSDPAAAVAAIFIKAPSEDVPATAARGDAEQALVATAEEIAGKTGGAPASDDPTKAAGDGTDAEGDAFSDVLNDAQAETEGAAAENAGAAPDADALKDIEAKLRASREGLEVKDGAQKTETADAASTDGQAAPTPAANGGQPNPASDAARHGAHPVDMQQVQLDAKPIQVPAAASPHPATQTVQVPLDGVAVQIAKAATEGIDRFRIELHPASLGGVDITLEIGRDGRVDAAVRADRPETLDLLQRDARQLARALQDAGLQADSGSFSFQRRDEGGRQPSLFADFGGPRGSGSEARGVATDTIYRTVRPSGVDLRV